MVCLGYSRLCKAEPGPTLSGISIAKCLLSTLSFQDGQTALMAASFEGHLPIVERLLAAGVQPDLQRKVLLI